MRNGRMNWTPLWPPRWTKTRPTSPRAARYERTTLGTRKRDAMPLRRTMARSSAMMIATVGMMWIRSFWEMFSTS